MEPGFLGLGKILRELHTTAGRLTDTVRARAEHLRGALVQSRLAGEDGITAICNQQLACSLDRTAGLLNSLSQVEELLRHFHAQAEGIQRIGLFLKVCSLSLAVESVRTPACMDAFGAFVGELRALAARISQLGESIQSEVERTQEAQARGIRTMKGGLEKMRSLAKSLEAKCRVTASEAQQLMDSSCATLHETESCIQEVSRHAQDAVFHLQFGDIMRQKAEHISDSLQEAAGALGRGGDRAAAENRAVAGGIVAVQVSQMESIAREVSEACEKLRASFAGINAGTKHFAESLERGGDAGAEPRLDPLHALLADAEGLERLREEGCGLSQQARGAAKSAMESLGRLGKILDQVKAINHDMHLQALNAIIKTAPLGTGGATLEVLAIEVDRLFLQSNDLVQKIAATLEQILCCARGMLDENPITPGEPVTEEVCLRAALRNIAGAFGQFAATADQVGVLVQTQQEQLTMGRSQLDFLLEIAGTIEAQVRELRQVQKSFMPVHLDPAAIQASALEGLGARYTMASEREIHAKVFGLQQTPDGSESNADEPMVPPGRDETQHCNSEPRQTGKEQPTNARSRASVPLAASDLGENVELF
jgi:archaellum component FlaC